MVRRPPAPWSLFTLSEPGFEELAKPCEQGEQYQLSAAGLQLDVWVYRPQKAFHWFPRFPYFYDYDTNADKPKQRWSLDCLPHRSQRPEAAGGDWPLGREGSAARGCPSAQWHTGSAGDPRAVWQLGLEVARVCLSRLTGVYRPWIVREENQIGFCSFFFFFARWRTERSDIQ